MVSNHVSILSQKERKIVGTNNMGSYKHQAGGSSIQTDTNQ